MSFQPAHGIRDWLLEPSARAATSRARNGRGARPPIRQLRGVFARAGLKIALRGQDQDRGGRDQQQIVRVLGSPAGHQASVRRAWCRRRTAAQPNNVAIRIRPAGMALLSRGRSFGFSRLRLARDAGDDGAAKIAAAVSLAASI